MNEQIKLGLLGLIAATLIVQTALQLNGGNSGNATVGANTAMSSAQPATNPLQQPDFNQPATPPVPAGPTTGIKFEEESFDFGNVPQHSTNKHTFKFTNTGEHPLIISNATGSCGCTVPDYPKEPIAPGKTGVINVEYKPGTQKGNQTKTVTVTANTEPAQTRVNITAFVEEVEGPAPVQ